MTSYRPFYEHYYFLKGNSEISPPHPSNSPQRVEQIFQKKIEIRNLVARRTPQIFSGVRPGNGSFFAVNNRNFALFRLFSPTLPPRSVWVGDLDTKSIPNDAPGLCASSDGLNLKRSRRNRCFWNFWLFRTFQKKWRFHFGAAKKTRVGARKLLMRSRKKKFSSIWTYGTSINEWAGLWGRFWRYHQNLQILIQISRYIGPLKIPCFTAKKTRVGARKLLMR